MSSIVPAILAQIDPAQERRAAVDHDELLVMTAARRMASVEMKMQSLVRLPAEQDPLHPLALEGEHHVKIPGQDVDLSSGRVSHR